MSRQRYLRVRNFEQFQHYKERNPIWIKLYCSLLDDYEFAQLPDMIIGKTGDKGGDIVAIRPEHNSAKTWVVQVKAVTAGSYVGLSALNEVMNAQAVYNAHVSVVATNGDFTGSIETRQKELVSAGFDVKKWNGVFLEALLDKFPDISCEQRALREYQKDITEKSLQSFDNGSNKVQFVVATGLGKTVIAAEIAAKLWERGIRRCLVLCHNRDLALQLEQSFWAQLPKSIPTRYFFDGAPPLAYEGINFGLYQTLSGYLGGITPGDYEVVIVDEAHYALGHSFNLCIEHLSPKFLIGMTATPWRGDGKSIDQIFGEPIAKVSLVDGMAQGYLAQVDYRIFCDNIDWDIIPEITKTKLTIRDLNKKLFVPQRDEAILSEIIKIAKEIPNPRIAIFSSSIPHSHSFAALLSAAGIPCQPLSGIDKVERRRRLMEFSSGRLASVTSVNVLNEGIDIPEVNLMVFMRATHSRRIFVQQLGRGLRVAPDKEKVIVLDFVSDIRRLAEMSTLDHEIEMKAQRETVLFNDSAIKFSDIKAQTFVDAWLNDVADLAEAEDSEKLKFPEVF